MTTSKKAAIWALAFTLVQVTSGLVLAPSHRYRALNNWDSQHYLDIARRGYQVNDPEISRISSDDVHADRANVAFFPAYPYLSRYFSRATGVGHETALLLVSQFFCWLSWFYFLNLTGGAGLGLALAALAYPTSFFLVTGYSESLFIAMLLGMVFWTEKALASESKGRALLWIAAAVHGFFLTATRFLGLPLAAFPAFQACFTRKKSGLVAAFLTSAFAFLGVTAFFWYCARRFGAWDLYLQLQQRGWQNFPDYLAVLKPLSYVPRFFFEDTMDSISRASIPFTVGLLVFRIKKDFRVRESHALYLCAALLLYVSIAGKARANMDSMSRYTLPVYWMILAAYARALSAAGREFRFTWKVKTAVLSGLALQFYLFFMFLRGHWVA